VIITSDRQAGVEQVLKQHAELRAMGVINKVVLSNAEILASPHVLIGTVNQIVAELQERRRRYGVSLGFRDCCTIFEYACRVTVM
jgi:hypothetical protein